MRRRTCLGAGAIPLVAQAGAERGRILVPHDVRLDFDRFVAGRAMADLHQYDGPHARRDVVELVLLMQALELGGWGPRPELVSVPTVPRLVRELALGQGVVSGTTYWKTDVDEPAAFHFSRPMVQDGEFVAGLYTLATRADVLSVRERGDLRALRFVSNRHWRVDWATLQALGVTQVAHADQWEAMPRMIRAGRADVVLAPFQPGTDMGLTVGGVSLVPVPGVKVALRGTRHYLIPKAHPQAHRCNEVLEVGLRGLQDQGVVRRAYQQSGFFNPQVANWRVL
ncbi:hypothetical protein [Inhella gelatinilytica]|uniref:Uncharacterized protein n=1 Tax=Inhella gelatinilytica TaxID=2795030 RepID=A0A931IV84_9BURK|nr:hypothetical protein [Inhella gelatinilytica]MBH9552176.1 hypothetical protein [Inhella gelatinilytica]